MSGLDFPTKIYYYIKYLFTYNYIHAGSTVVLDIWHMNCVSLHIIEFIHYPEIHTVA
jgi:hypothetical protein